ncbi:putative glycolipid-binding domain-containing protein [Roseivivax isoporae]|uniref:Glycolipid-binding domain-containing protein n=1 Tax=Roseivivax isoporae LMG 25204 TaxID=1449351 RepID=X7F6I7_9RHOB|nr:putative glycolipid-binding domain-containing protein [Roseivivax isoporae]ETX27679.1 hypothetical protein RISW2_12090 [Roseivivax isoporae LMG 25204]
MTGRTVGTMRWRALDREGRDRCRLVQNDAGWMLVGHARFREREGASSIDYVIRCDPDWQTLVADLSGSWRDTPLALHVAREGTSWRVNDRLQPEAEGATDIDLGFSPATNLMPIRRLPEIGGIDACAAWLRDPGAGLSRLDQRYTRGRGNVVHYRAEQTGYETDLKVAETGFVALYPGLWEAERAL